jgi:hypothetical protein
MAEQRALRIGYVDFAGNQGPDDGVAYAILDAANPRVGLQPVGVNCTADDAAFQATVQVLTLWVADLPDVGFGPWKTNEGLLKLSGRTRRSDKPDEKLDLAATIDFAVRDRRSSGIDFELGFIDVLFKNRLIVGLELIELDKDARQYYRKIKEAVGPAAGNELTSIAKGVPYLQLATKIADGLMDAFGNNDPDRAWHANPAFAVKPLPGAPFLRTGAYVVYEDPRHDLQPGDLAYLDQAVCHEASGKQIDRNYLMFAVGISRPENEEVRTNLTAASG